MNLERGLDFCMQTCEAYTQTVSFFLAATRNPVVWLILQGDRRIERGARPAQAGPLSQYVAGSASGSRAKGRKPGGQPHGEQFAADFIQPANKYARIRSYYILPLLC